MSLSRPLWLRVCSVIDDILKNWKMLLCMCCASSNTMLQIVIIWCALCLRRVLCVFNGVLNVCTSFVYCFLAFFSSAVQGYMVCIRCLYDVYMFFIWCSLYDCWWLLRIVNGFIMALNVLNEFKNYGIICCNGFTMALMICSDLVMSVDGVYNECWWGLMML